MHAVLDAARILDAGGRLTSHHPIANLSTHDFHRANREAVDSGLVSHRADGAFTLTPAGREAFIRLPRYDVQASARFALAEIDGGRP